MRDVTDYVSPALWRRIQMSVSILHLLLFLKTNVFMNSSSFCSADELCSGIVNGRVLNVKLYTHRRQINAEELTFVFYVSSFCI